MSRRQKKYTSDRQVLEDIDRNQKRIARLTSKAEGCDAEANLLAMADDANNRAKITDLRNQADDFRKRADSYEKIRGQKLKNTLSALRTETLPLEGIPQHIVLQNVK